MPLPKALARFNVRVTNPILRRVVLWLPGFAIVRHVGRVSGRSYETPLLLFQRGDRYVIAMTYGPDTQWARNVLVAGGCDAWTRQRSVRLVHPELALDPHHRLVPWPIGLVLCLLRADDVMILRASE